MNRAELKELVLTGNGKPYLTGNIYSKEQVNEILASSKGITSHEFSLTNENGETINYEFFSNNHIFAYKVLPIKTLSCSMVTPLDVVPREGCEDGIIDNFDKYKAVFSRNEDVKRIFSLDELLDVLVAYSYIDK